jgi:hypothetical protein
LTPSPVSKKETVLVSTKKQLLKVIAEVFLSMQFTALFLGRQGGVRVRLLFYALSTSHCSFNEVAALCAIYFSSGLLRLYFDCV